MKLIANKDLKRLFLILDAILLVFLLLSQLTVKVLYHRFSLPLLALTALAAAGILAACWRYLRRQEQIMEAVVTQIHSYLAGNTDARIDCGDEGELYHLFHTVNTMAAVLNAHAANELREKDFLKNTISDISHQLKTPLAALSVYNGLVQESADDTETVRKFATLSERELDRIETLVQNLLKVTKLDAGAVVFQMSSENVADMMKDVKLHFAFRAQQEGKTLALSGADNVSLLCDCDWILEAVDNLVKNALDHTDRGDFIRLEWRTFASVVQITVQDNGSGIHPEDMPHIFKRFYRSRFSQDAQGIGLGLPLAKAIVEGHGGTITVDSELNHGTIFTIRFLIPTKL